MRTDAVAAHYTHGDLLDRLSAALREDGANPDRPTIEALAPYDQFHGRGLEATEDLAKLVTMKSGDHILDVGSGIGGPARYIAKRFGCLVTGIDLTPDFVDVARQLTRLAGLERQARFEVGDALAMPFADGTFDGAYSMNVSMNIADRAGLYRELHRVLKRGAWLVLSEAAKGPGPDPTYPMPWAATPAESHLETPEATRRGLEAAGFEIERLESTAERSRAFAARSKAMVERGEKPPHRAVMLIHADRAPQIMANMAKSLADGCTVPIEVLARKR